MIRDRRKTPGFSLVEVITAILVISFTILYTFQLFSAGYLSYREAQKRTTLVELSLSKLEELMAQAGKRTASQGDFGYYQVAAPSGKFLKGLKFSDFRWTITATAPPSGLSSPSLQQYVVTVTGPMTDNPKIAVMNALLPPPPDVVDPNEVKAVPVGCLRVPQP